jgi:hypothetical protein
MEKSHVLQGPLIVEITTRLREPIPIPRPITSSFPNPMALVRTLHAYLVSVWPHPIFHLEAFSF